RPPILKTPPPNPPPEPGPTPAPMPEPTPPDDPDPIPAFDPIPFEAGPDIFAVGKPSVGTLASAILTCGGNTTEGSTASLGCSFRTTIAGGVNCSCAILGSLPWGASILARSPPPPPPPISWGFITG